MKLNSIYQGDSLEILKEFEEESINCCVTSPPYYGLRDYGVYGQIGLENTPEQYIEKLVLVFRELKRVLKADGTLWLNLGDSYWSKKDESKKHSIYKPKDLMGIPWRVALALQQDGWYLRSDIIWNKPNVIPESVIDRPTKSHEYIFLLSKSEKYYYDYESIKEESVYKEWDPVMGSLGAFGNNQSRARENKVKGSFNGKNGEAAFRAIRNKRNKRDVWTVTTKAFKGAHFATFPIDLIEPCILAGCPEGGTVIDIFGGSGTTAEAAIKHRRNYILTELNKDYVKLSEERINGTQITLL